MTKRKIHFLVNKSLNNFVKKAKEIKFGTKLWKYSWVSISTARKNNYKESKRIKYVEEIIYKLLNSLNDKKEIHINYSHFTGAEYKNLGYGKHKIDWINIPCLRRFKKRCYFYKTIFHELFHCLMERLEISAKIDNYEDEEITAETSAMLFCSLIGINAWDESYRYIGDYLVNSGGYIIHRGRIEYIKKSVEQLLNYVLKLK